MASPNFANTRMVVGVNHKLRFWWRNLKQDHELEVRRLLGGLTFLLFVIPDRYLIMALLKFWDPTKTVFRFRDFELTPTIEEIGGFLDLSYRNHAMIVPHKQSPKKFLRSLGLKYNPHITSLDFDWISLDFLYSRFGREDGHEVFKKEFTCSIEKWKKYRLNAFAVALLGCLVFPKERGKIDIRLTSVVRAMTRGRDKSKVTIVPMILAEMLRGLSACVRGKRFYEGCNFLLQLWAIEHFYKRCELIDILNGMGNKIASHPIRMKHFIAPVGVKEWFTFLNGLSGCHIQWKYFWLRIRAAMVRNDERYFIELIGLICVQPYAPLRVLRQFGQIQMIPLHSSMNNSEYDFESGIPRVHDVLQRWEKMITIDAKEQRPFCTPEYYVWMVEYTRDRALSEEGLPGIADERARIRAHNLLSNQYNVTPEMQEQMVPT